MELPEGFVLETQEAPTVPQGFQLEPEQETPRLEQGVNLGLAALQGYTWGAGPKVMSAIGAGQAKVALEAGEAVNNLAGGSYEAPKYSELYKKSVQGYQDRVQQSYEDNPILTPVAEIAGGIKSGLQLGATKLGQGVNNWANGQKATGPLTQKALNFLQRSGKNAALGEAGYRTYKVGTAAPGEEHDALTTGAPVGGMLGMAAPALSAGIGAAGKLVTPQADEALKPVAQLAQKYKIPVSLDQVTSSAPIKNVQKISQELPFSGAGNFRDKQMQAFNRALTRTFGQESDRITPELMNKAFKDVGKEFDQFGRGKAFDVNRFKQSIDDILADQDAYSKEAIEAFKKQADVIMGEAQEGIIKGEKLSHQRGRVNALARKANDFDKQTLFRDLENAVIDTMTEGDEAAQAALSQAKQKYKNLLVIEPLARKAKGGNISPTQLTSRVGKIYGRQFTTGQAGEIGDLARIGNELLPQLGGSDTTQKLLYAGGALGGAQFAPVTTATALGGNAAMQKWINQNPKLVEKVIQDEFLKQLQAPVIPGIGTTTGVLAK